MPSNRASEDCLKAAKSALNKFTDADLEAYVSRVLDKMRSYDNIHGSKAVSKAIDDVNDSVMQDFVESMQTKVNDAAKVDKRADRIKDGKQTLLQTLVRHINGVGDNVESAQRKAYKRLMDKFFNILTDDETVYINKSENDINIVRAIDGKETESDIAKSIAEKFKTYLDGRNIDMVASNALPLRAINKDRSLRAIHDASRILSGGRSLAKSALSKKYSISEARSIWKETISPLLNMEETFHDTDVMNLDGTVDADKADKVLNDIYDNITKGKPNIFTRSGKGKPTMFFYWKNMEAWMNYNKQYGQGNLLNAMRADVMASSNKIGMAEILGSSPQAALNDLSKVEHEFNPQSARANNRAKDAYDWVSGNTRAPISPKIASYSSAIRALTGSSRLVGRLVFRSFPDLVNGAAYAKRWGDGFFKIFGQNALGMFNAIPTEERRYLAGKFKELTDTHSGYMMRFIDATSPGELISNVNTLAYRYTFMEAWDKGNKISALLMQSRFLADNSHLPFASLNPQMKIQFNKFNISADEWNILRHKTGKLNGKKVFSMDSVEGLTNDDLRKMYKVENQDMPLYQLKNELYRKVYSMFDVATENAVLTPGSYMKSLMAFGTRSGTLRGELLRSLTQFKLYTAEYIRRILYEGFKDMDGIQAKLQYGALLFASSIPLAYASMFFDNIAQGKSMPVWDKMSFGEQAGYASDLVANGTGMLNSLFVGQGPGGVGQLFSTPSLNLLYDSTQLAYRVAEGASSGDMHKIGKAFAKVGKDITPGAAMPFIAPYVDKLIHDHPYLQGGQTQLYGK